MPPTVARDSPPSGDPALSTALTDLRPGMVLTVRGERLPIRYSVWLEQDDVVWSEHLLDTGGLEMRWFTVEAEEEDEGLILTTWQTRPDLVSEPGGRTVRVDGRRWRRYEHGTANFMTEGEGHYPPAGSCEYHDYRDGEDRLSFERFATLPWEVSLGRRVAPGEVTVEGAPDAAQH